MKRLLFLLGVLAFFLPYLAQAQISSRANQNLETFFIAGSTGLGKSEDSAHVSGDTGTMSLTVRQDTAAALAGTDADYQPLITDASGRLHTIATQSGTWNVGTVTTVTNLANWGGSAVAIANGAASTALRVTDANNDPCQTSGIPKSSVAVAVTTDAQLVAISGTTVIYVCGFSVSIAGTAPTMRLVSGTGSVCATGLTGRTGAYAPLTGSMIVGGGAATVLSTAAGDALCMDTEGTSPSVQGYLTYVQQ